ncbi:MAG TPA: M81 family metallopeptidase [Caldilineaceae bacterium]|nr:M81 family metallopeptidase [Caldilineaceae bacterium]
MRIAVACFTHESNTFAAKPTVLADFTVHHGQALIDHYTPTFHEVAGYIAGAEEYDFDLYPTVAANATPAGPLTRQTYETLVGEILDALRHAPELDGLLLALHGAMVAEDFPQADAETVRRVRALMGPDFPIVVTHDYHGNVPESLVRDATALIIYKTNPHIDQRERGLQAAELLARTIRGEVRPVSAIAKPDVLFNIAFHNTSLPPMQPIMQAAIALEKEPGILAASIAAGYQYADVPAMGPSVVVVADGDQALAERGAQRLAGLIWAARDQLRPDLPGAAEAVRMAMEATRTPVALFDMGDNIGGGSAADSTFILEELLAQKADGWVMTIFDPESVQACAQAGIGATVSLQVGGKTDTAHGPTLPITGRVRTLHDGSFEETERRHGGGRYFNQGLTAVVEVNRTGPGKGGLLVLNSKRTPPMSIHQITCVGIQPHQQRILVAKGTIAPRAAYEPVCAQIIQVDTGGACDINRPPSEFKLARRSFYEWQEG